MSYVIKSIISRLAKLRMKIGKLEKTSQERAACAFSTKNALNFIHKIEKVQKSCVNFATKFVFSNIFKYVIMIM